MTNLQLNFKNQFFLFFFFLFSILSLILFIKFFPYYSSQFFNFIVFSFWFSLDFFDYYFTFAIWLSFIFFTTFLNSIYSYFFISHVISKKKNLTPFFFKFSYPFDYSVTTNLSKKDFKFFLFNWLQTSNSIYKTSTLSTLFSFSSKPNLNLTSFYFNLYNSVYHINLLELNNLNLKNLFIFSYYNSFLFKNFSLFSSFFLKNKHPYFSSFLILNKPYYETNFFYTLNSLNYFFNKVSNNNSFKTFYFTNFNFKNLNFFSFFFNETKNILNNYNIFLNNAKNQRWLYRYSIIHRKTFKNSHKLTNFKKILNSGFVNKDLSFKNIWNSEILNKWSKVNVMHSFSNLNHFNFFKSSSFLLKNSSFKLLNFENYLKNLKFIEFSFFWNIKRFALFNSLSTNSFLLNYSLKKNFFEKNPLKLNFFLKNFYYLNQSFFLTNSNFFDINQSSTFMLNINPTSLFTPSSSSDFFNLEDLEIINLFLNSSNEINNLSLNYTYFNYLNYLYLNPYKCKFFKFNLKNLYLSPSFHNFFFLNDLIFFFNFK